jgi:hypothetical protein
MMAAWYALKKQTFGSVNDKEKHAEKFTLHPDSLKSNTFCMKGYDLTPIQAGTLTGKHNAQTVILFYLTEFQNCNFIFYNMFYCYKILIIKIMLRSSNLATHL